MGAQLRIAVRLWFPLSVVVQRRYTRPRFVAATPVNRAALQHWYYAGCRKTIRQ